MDSSVATPKANFHPPQYTRSPGPTLFGTGSLIRSLNQQLKTPLQLISNSQSRPYSRWCPVGLAPRTKHSPDACPRKTLSPYRFEYLSGNEPENLGSEQVHAPQAR